MAESAIVKADGLLRQLLADRGISVDRIVFFGSHAEGTVREGSDLDIIVISRAFEGKDIFERIDIAAGIHRRLVEQLAMPVDLLYYAPSEWETETSLIIHAAKARGVMVGV